MNTTIQFLDALKARHCGASDYAISKILGVTQQTVSRYRVGKDFLGDSTAIRVAKLLEIDPAYVVACAHAERAKAEDEKAVWTGFAALFTPPPGVIPDNSICIMLNRAKEKTCQILELSVFGQLLAI